MEPFFDTEFNNLKQDLNEFNPNFYSPANNCLKKVALSHTVEYILDTKEQINQLEKKT